MNADERETNLLTKLSGLSISFVFIINKKKSQGTLWTIQQNFRRKITLLYLPHQKKLHSYF